MKVTTVMSMLLVSAATLSGALEATGARPPDGALVGRGAAAAREVGRPLDVVRDRAAGEARLRALEDLASQGGAHGIGLGDLGALEDLDERGLVAWEMRYWTDGSVSATATLPTDALAGVAGAP